MRNCVSVAAARNGVPPAASIRHLFKGGFASTNSNTSLTFSNRAMARLDSTNPLGLPDRKIFHNLI